MRRRVRTGQLVVAEVTGVAVVVAAFGPRWVVLGVAILAAAVFVATFGRAGGRWWYEAVGLSRRFRERRRRAAAQVVTAAVEGGLVPVPVAWLRTLAPGFSLRSVAVGGQAIGVGADADGWFAVVEVGALWDDEPVPTVPAAPTASPWAPEAGTLRLWPGAGPPPVPYRQLAALCAQVSAVQVVLAPGPSPAQPHPAWVAVRVTPPDALATERTGGVSAVERTVATAAAKVVRTLEAAGLSARCVSPDGLVAALVEATGLDGPPQEHWSWWRAGRMARTHYTVAGWTPAHGLLAPAVTQLAVRFDSGRGSEPVVTAVVAAAPAALRRATQEVLTAASAQAVRLRPLDGEQSPAVWATAPTAHRSFPR